MYRRLVTTVGDVMDTQVRTVEEDLDVRPCEHNYQANCNNCRLGGICLPFALQSKEIDELDSIVRRSKARALSGCCLGKPRIIRCATR